MKRTIVAAAMAIALVAAASAEGALSKSSSLPKADGVVSASEYQYTESAKGMKLGVTLGSDDMLYLAVEAPTSGWAAVGVGGLVMNGSRLMFGATQDGKPAFQEKLGKGHFYTDAKDQVVKSWSVKTSGNDTILELSLPASAALWKGKINVTYAYSKAAKFESKHVAYAFSTLSVK